MMPQGMPGLGGFNPQMMQELLRRKQMEAQSPMMGQQLGQAPRPQFPPQGLPQGPPPVQNQMPVNPMMQRPQLPMQGQRMGQQRPQFSPNSRSRFGR